MWDSYDSSRQETAGGGEVALDTAVQLGAGDNLAQTRRDCQKTKDQLVAMHGAELLEREKGRASEVTALTVGYENQLTDCKSTLNKLTTTHNKLLQENSTLLSSLEAANEKINHLEELDKNSPSTITKLQNQIKAIQTASDTKSKELESDLTSRFTATINSKESTIKDKIEQIKQLDLEVTKTRQALDKNADLLRTTEAAKTKLEGNLHVVTRDRDVIQTDRDRFDRDLQKEKADREFDCRELRLEVIEREKLRAAAEEENVTLKARFYAEKAELLAEKKRLADEHEVEKTKWREAINVQEEKHTVRIQELINQNSITEGDVQRKYREEKENNLAELERVRNALISDHRDEIQRREASAERAKDELKVKLAMKVNEINSMKAAYEKEREQYIRDLGVERMKNVAFEKAMMGKLDENSSEVFKAIAALVEKQSSRVETLEHGLAAHEARANKERDERLDQLRQEHKDDVQRINREWNDAMVLQATRHSENTTRSSAEVDGHLKRIGELEVERDTLRRDLRELKADKDSRLAERDSEIGELKVRETMLEIQKKTDVESFGKERLCFRSRIKCLRNSLETERTNYNTALVDLRNAVEKNEEAKGKMIEDANMLKFQMKQDHDRLVEQLTKTNSVVKEQLIQSQELQRSERDEHVVALAREHDEKVQHMNALNDLRMKFEEAKKDHIEEKDRFGARIGTMLDEITTLKEQAARRAEKISNLEKTNKNYKDQIGKLNGVLDEMKEQAARCAEKLGNLQKTNEYFKELNEQFHGALMTYNKRLDKLTSEHAQERRVMRLEHSALGNLMKPRLQTLEKIFQESIQHLEAYQDLTPGKSKTTWDTCLEQFSSAFESFIEMTHGAIEIEDGASDDINCQKRLQESSHSPLVNGNTVSSDGETDEERTVEGSKLNSGDGEIDGHTPVKRRRYENE